MSEKISVQLTEQTLFDFLLYHTYSKFSGFLSNVLGAAVAFMGIILMAMGKITWIHLLVYLAAGAAFIAYTPLLLKHRAKKNIEANPLYRDASEYLFDEEGIAVTRGEETKRYPWEKIQKAVVTPKNVGIYWDKEWAFIIPKEALADRFVPVMQMISTHIGAQNVRLR